MKKSKVVFTNKNYRLLSFKSFFIFFHFYLFSRGLPLAGFFFFLGGGERLKILYSRRVFFFYIQIFSLFLFLHFFTFFTFFTFSDFFTFLHFLHFYNFSEVTPVGVFFNFF